MRLEAGFDVRLRGSHRADAEGIHKSLEDVGADKSRQRRTKADVFHAEVQQGQKDGHGFLFVPGKDKAQGEVVDRALEGLGKLEGQGDGGIGIIALTAVEKPRERSDLAEIKSIEAIFAAGQGKNQGVLRGLLHEFGVVLAGRTDAIAAAHEEHMADGAGLHGVKDGRHSV